MCSGERELTLSFAITLTLPTFSQRPSDKAIGDFFFREIRFLRLSQL